MKIQLLICALALILFAGCTNQKEETVNEEQIVVEPANKFEKLLISFTDKHPNWKQNDVVSKKTDAKLTDSVIKLINKTDALKDLTFELTQVRDSETPGMSVAHFEFKDKKVTTTFGTAVYELTLLAFINDKQAEQLTDNKFYKVSGRVVKNAYGAEFNDYGNSGKKYQMGAYGITKVKFEEQK